MSHLGYRDPLPEYIPSSILRTALLTGMRRLEATGRRHSRHQLQGPGGPHGVMGRDQGTNSARCTGRTLETAKDMKQQERQCKPKPTKSIQKPIRRCTTSTRGPRRRSIVQHSYTLPSNKPVKTWRLRFLRRTGSMLTYVLLWKSLQKLNRTRNACKVN